MGDAMVHELESSAGDVRLKRWEFYAFVADAFLLIMAGSAALGLFRHRPGVMPRVVVTSGIILLVPVALLPVISAASRFYYNSHVNVVWVVVCTLLAAITVGIAVTAIP